MVSALCEITIGVFYHLDITSPMDVDQRVAYIKCILRGEEINKYKAVMLECKQLAKYLVGDKWTIGKLKGISTEDFWTWDNSYGLAYVGYA